MNKILNRIRGLQLVRNIESMNALIRIAAEIAPSPESFETTTRIYNELFNIYNLRQITNGVATSNATYQAAVKFGEPHASLAKTRPLANTEKISWIMPKRRGHRVADHFMSLTAGNNQTRTVSYLRFSVDALKFCDLSVGDRVAFGVVGINADGDKEYCLSKTTDSISSWKISALNDSGGGIISIPVGLGVNEIQFSQDDVALRDGVFYMTVKKS